nr:hypothetical protein [uncultured Cohaesibacter sp.]
MTHMQTLLLWDSATRHHQGKTDAFQDPFERPEWQPFLPWVNILHAITRKH